MNLWDGVLISSFFWFFACLACLLRGMSYGWNDFDIPRLNWTDAGLLDMNMPWTWDWNSDMTLVCKRLGERMRR